MRVAARRYQLALRPGVTVTGSPPLELYSLPDGRAVVTFSDGPPVGFKCWTCALKMTGTVIVGGPFPGYVHFPRPS